MNALVMRSNASLRPAARGGSNGPSWWRAIVAVTIAFGAGFSGCSERNAASATAGGGAGAASASSDIDGPDGLGDMPTALDWQDISPGWDLPGTKLMLTGTVYESDARTPAANVIVYYYQTDPDGRYRHVPGAPRSMAPNELGQTHGFIRGWVKTGVDGRYAIRTVRPGPYPTMDEPAHIHATIKEPDRAEYYIDDFVFDDDPLLTSTKRRKLENRGGSGVLRLIREGDLLIGERDIILGQNVPSHRGDDGSTRARGKKVGEDVASFMPIHAWGPDRGTRTCPICKYGWYHGILFFAGSSPDWPSIKRWLAYFEAQSTLRRGTLKVFFVYANPEQYSEEGRIRELEALGRELGLEHVALTFVPSFDDRASEIVLNEIDPGASTTIMVYRRSRIIDLAENLAANEESFQRITARLDATTNAYFNAPK